MNMKKWGRNLILLALLTPAVQVQAAAPLAKPIHVTMDGKVLQFDVAPVKINDRILVPLRTISEAVGSQVGWDAVSQTVTITRNSDSLALTLGKKTAKKNDTSVSLDVPAQMINDRTMVPVRFLSEGLGLQVAWDDKSSTVIIKDAEKQAFTVKDIFKNNRERVALIKVFDEDGEELGTGSGFIIDASGKILTNYHVVEGATKAEVILQDKTYTTDQLLLGDSVRDLALLQIDAPNLTPVQLGDSSLLEIGDSVVAIGSPVGFQNTLSAGLVSGLERKAFDFGLGEEEKAELTADELAMLEQQFVQTNAPITHGSSGGALFNMQGEVIGVTSNSFNSFFGGELNFAIPSNDVKKFLAQTPTPKKLSETVAETPDDEGEGEGEGSERDWSFLEVEDKLFEEYPTYSIPGSTEKINLDYAMSPSDDNNHDISLVTDSTYFLQDGKVDEGRTFALLKEVLQNALTAGAKNPLLTVTLEYAADKVPDAPTLSVYYHHRTGKYLIEQDIAWALVDQKTGEMKYSIGTGAAKTVNLK